MSLVIKCGSCSGTLRLPDSLFGKTIKCPLCASVFKAQNNGAGFLPGTSGKVESVSSVSSLITACVNCQRRLKLPESYLGKMLRCPLCATNFIAQRTDVGPKPSILTNEAQAPGVVVAPGAAPDGEAPRGKKTVLAPSSAQPAPVEAEKQYRVACLHCQNPLKVLENMLGRTLRCPTCKKTFLAQAQKIVESQVRVAAAAAPPPPAPPAPVAAAPKPAPVAAPARAAAPAPIAKPAVPPPAMPAAAPAAAAAKPAPVAPPAPPKPAAPAALPPGVVMGTIPGAGAPLAGVMIMGCPFCRKTMTLPASGVSSNVKGVKCPHCARQFSPQQEMPEITAEAPKPAPPPPPPPLTPPPRVKRVLPAVLTGKKKYVLCRKCSKPLRLPLEAIGSILRCPACKTLTQCRRPRYVANLPPLAQAGPEAEVVAPQAAAAQAALAQAAIQAQVAAAPAAPASPPPK